MGLSLSLSLQPALPAFAVLSLSVNCFDLFLFGLCRERERERELHAEELL